MKKSVVKSWAVFLALVLVFSTLPVTAFAAASKTFFTTNAYGYRCTGSGNISGLTGNAVFNATSLPLEPTIPSSACTCEVWVLAHDESGALLGAEVKGDGTISATATYRANKDINDIYCTFKFNNTDLGGYILYNS